MRNDSNTASSELPAHWPVLALNGGGGLKRDALVARTVLELCQRSIKTLVVLHEPINEFSQSNEFISLGKKDVVVFGADFVKFSTKLIQNKCFRDKIRPFIHHYDLILVLTEEDLPIDSVCFPTAAKNRDEPPSGFVQMFSAMDNEVVISDFICTWLEKKVRCIPIWATVLIGGKSSRMGQPKHLLVSKNGKTWLENTVEVLERVAEQVVLSGAGEVPSSLCHLPRLADVSGVAGPLTGMLSAMRWNPDVSWLLVACDMPDLDEKGLQWLLSLRKPGEWGVVPRHLHSGNLEPLLAYYDFRCSNLFESMVLSRDFRIGNICANYNIITPTIPAEMLSGWRNCNRPEDI